MDDDRHAAEGSNIGCQQVRADGGAAHTGDDDLSHTLCGTGVRQGLPQRPGARELIGQAFDFTEHVLLVDLFDIGKVVKVHFSYSGFLFIIE